jgi:hypothetical protein
MRTFYDSMFSHLSEVQIPTRIMNQNNNYETLRPVCTESFRPGLSLKPGLKPENSFKSNAYQKT